MNDSHEPILGELGLYTPIFWAVVGYLIWRLL